MSKASFFFILFALSFAFAQEEMIMLEVVTNPPEASVYINKEKVGVSPSAYSFTVPGVIEVGVQKDSYEPWDTTLTLQPAQRLRIDHTLKEKSFFSLAQDTTVDGYRQRKDRVQAKIGQIDNEMNILLANEAVDYDSKVAAHQKYAAYRNELLNAIGTLDNNINIATAEALKADLAKEAAVAATKSAEAPVSSGGGLGWRGWTRILTFTAAAACGAMAGLKHKEMKDAEKKVETLNNTKWSSHEEYQRQYEDNKKTYDEKVLHRNIFAGGAGAFLLAGTLTFFF